MSKSILIHISSVPTPDCEPLEYALAMAAFDHNVRILFSGDGLFWLKPDQQPRIGGGKNPEKLIKALAMYGISDVAYLTSNESNESLSAIHGIPPIGQPSLSKWFTDAFVVGF